MMNIFFLNPGLHVILSTKRPERADHIAPFCCLKRWGLTSDQFQLNTQLGTLQYCVIKLLMAFATFILNLCGTIFIVLSNIGFDNHIHIYSIQVRWNKLERIRFSSIHFFCHDVCYV
jgi:hypothetical protein